jgi:hypothetical protein
MATMGSLLFLRPDSGVPLNLILTGRRGLGIGDWVGMLDAGQQITYNI